ncbi:hypothetical protein FRC07_014869 [Ceratobasidium sp. 392]|nr:hypothetical protein FRC07_014869 [Ceratobasidium sp. 392]
MLKSRREAPPVSTPRPTSPLPPRRSHDSRSDSPAPFTESERRRSNSDGTAPTPRPPVRPLVPHVPSPVQEKGFSPGSSTSDPRILRPSPAQQRSGGSSNNSSSLFLTHSLGMSRSQGGVSRETAPSVVSASSSSINAARTSPVKGRAAYDAKLMVREMDRLGLSSAVPSANASSLSLPLSNATLPTMATVSSAATPDTAPYQQLHVHVLPLFNSENLKVPIEDLNNLVRQHIQTVISRAPSRALAALEQDVRELVNTGMMTLNGKLAGLEEETLLTRVVQVWGQFWEQVLPYLEGVFLPLQTEKILQNLSKNPKPMRPGSPGSPSHDIPGVVPLVGCLTINVRSVVLQSFRDSIIAPIWQKLYEQFLSMGKDVEAGMALGDRYSRLQQMLLVLSSASPRSISLTQPPTPVSQGEEAVTHLLRAILRVRAQAYSGSGTQVQRFPPAPILGFGGASTGSGAAGMLFGATPRDRRGRIARRDVSYRDMNVFEEDGDGDIFGKEEPDVKSERQMEREFLEALKSPVIQSEEGTLDGRTPLARTVDQVCLLGSSPFTMIFTKRASLQADTRGMGFATAMRAVI